jgi:hypothetical protein
MRRVAAPWSQRPKIDVLDSAETLPWTLLAPRACGMAC